MALTRTQRIAYGFGHVFNDLCACLWFTYFITYYMNVLNISMANAGNLLLIGQVADGISTTFIGIESDRTGEGGFRGYGRRKTWHLIGSVCVLFSFPFIFNPCPVRSDEWAQLLYFAPFIVIFQFGWAAVQNSHMALIPRLASNTQERTQLNSIRFAFTFSADIAVYLCAFALLQFNAAGVSDTLTPADAANFRILVIIVVSLGCVCSAVFHLFVIENPVLSEEQQQLLQQQPQRARMRPLQWLVLPKFYALAILYMLTRLIVNVSQVYIPLYLVESLGLTKVWIAIVPLGIYFTGMVTSVTLEMCHVLGRHRKLTNLLGLCVIFGFSASSYFIRVDKMAPWPVAAPAVCLGAGSSIIVIMTMSLTADFIGADQCSSAFVYGVMSLVDKVSNGVAVWIIQHVEPGITPGCDRCRDFFRIVEGFVIGGIAVAAFVFTICLLPVSMHRGCDGGSSDNNSNNNNENNIVGNDNNDENNDGAAAVRTGNDAGRGKSYGSVNQNVVNANA